MKKRGIVVAICCQEYAKYLDSLWQKDKEMLQRQMDITLQQLAHRDKQLQQAETDIRELMNLLRQVMDKLALALKK